MFWKQHEDNVKNCINVDLKCFIDLTLRMEFSKLFDSLIQKENKEYLRLSGGSENSFKLLLLAAPVW